MAMVSGANIAGQADPRLPVPGEFSDEARHHGPGGKTYLHRHGDLNEKPAYGSEKNASPNNTVIGEPVPGGAAGSVTATGIDHDQSSDDATLRQRHIARGRHGPAHLETYMSYAAAQRELERTGQNAAPIEKGYHADLTEDERERLNARRALRTASWWGIFFLITTDILGPFNAPYAISQVGYVPGVLLYFFMGVIACYTGLLLAYLFGKLDSDRFPVVSYSDIGERLLGSAFRHLVTVLQSIQLIVNVGTLILSNAQNLSQLDQGKLCFVVGLVIWMALGMIMGQIRSLNNFAWFANGAVWINLLIIFLSMGFIAHSAPNYAAAFASYGNFDLNNPPPVQRQTFVNQKISFQINGVMNMVFAYGGAMIFPEFLAEMRRPMDFWKGMCCAQALIFVAYLLYGLFVYSYQGQYTLALAYQGVSVYAWQSIGNALAIVTAVIAAGLYGNIGIKVAYIQIVEGWFNGPPLMSKKGRYVWSGMVFVYWALAFVVGAAIPQVQTISGLIAAVCILQFTYTFPPLLMLAFQIRRDTIRFGSVGQGIFGGMWYWKLFNFVLFLAALATAGLGMYGSGLAIQSTFETAQATSFGCAAPV